MKNLILFLFLFLSQFSFATNYYVKSTGNDALSGLDDANAWKTVNKVNSFIFAANDHIYFNRGDIWKESLVIPRNNLFIEAYGSGANPKLSGLETITSWTNLGSNIWESNATNAPDDVDIVLVDGEQKAPGRYPNTGYLTYQSSTGSSYTASSLPGSPSFSGGECVSRKYRWILDRETITSHSAQTLNVSSSGQPTYNNMGLFVQKHNNTLDQQGEWCYQAASNKLRMYSTSTPATTKLSFLSVMCNLGSRLNTSIDGIEFEGGATAGIQSNGGNTGTIIKNCIIRNCGVYGINVGNTASLTVDNNQVIDILGLAMYLNENNNGGLLITNNVINRSGWIPGLGARYGNSPFDDSYSGMICIGNGVIAKYNNLDSIGYKGINFNGSNILIERNVVSNFCMTKDDGGAIYTWSQNGTGGYTNRIIRKNVTINSIGVPDGSTDGTPESHHIYMDGGAMQVIIDSNTCINSDFEDCGIFTNNCSYITIRSNTFYNVSNSIRFNRLPDYLDRNVNMIMTRNISYPSDFNFMNWNGHLYNPVAVDIKQDMRNMFTRIDSNFYRGDLVSNSTSAPFYYFAHCSSPGCSSGFLGPFFETLTQWKTTINSEVNSVNMSNAAKVFQYNTTNTPFVYSFPGLSKKDVYGTTYNNNATIQGYSSILFIDNGASGNVPPTANAGPDQIKTLPVNTATLSGSGTDSDGSVSSYAWVKVSGPATGVITSPSLASTGLTALVQGVYKFQLTVTDNGGAIGRDTVQITVNAAGNISPVANAGIDRSITLPTNLITLNGSGTDADGTIGSYSWSKIAGPTGTFFTVNNTANLSLTNLVAGTYDFVLLVTDNSGGIGKDTARLIVYAAANTAPVSNAGPDKLVYLPSTSVVLNGSGTDADPGDAIISYTWLKISGPAGGTITPSNTPTTTISALQAGTYMYRLTIEDQNLSIASDDVYITVYPVNIPPTVSAGPDQIITLPLNSVYLYGSGSDVDGTITFSWSKLSGPTGVNFITNNTQTLFVNTLVAGTYLFVLSVTDNRGAVVKDTVQVICNPVPNITPVANAGSNQTITLPTSTTVLAGIGTDSDGIIAGYVWTKLSGPAGGTGLPTPPFNNLTVIDLQQGVYQYELAVTDNNGGIGRDTMQVTVNPGPTNIAPVAYAGANIVIQSPITVSTLSGSGNDVDGVITTYAWVKISGPAGGTITSPASAISGVTALAVGAYLYELTVTDDSSAVNRDTVQLTVLAANVVPVINAGLDISITLPTNSASLMGTAIDTDGSVSSTVWTKVSGPPGVNYVTNTNLSLPLNNLVQGVYGFEFLVTDNSGGITRDTVLVTVVAAANVLPVAVAGPNLTITLPTNSVTMAGSGTDSDGTISSYLWSKTAGPGSFIITNIANPTTTITGLVEGLYTFQLFVTDNSGGTAFSTMTVRVNPATVIIPASGIYIWFWH